MLFKCSLNYDNTWDCHNANTFSFDPVHPGTSIRIFKKAATSVLAAALNDQRDSSLYFIAQISNRLSQEKTTSSQQLVVSISVPISRFKLQIAGISLHCQNRVQRDCFPGFKTHVFPYSSKSNHKRKETLPLRRSIRLARRARCLSPPRAWRGQTQAPPEAPGR